MSHSPPVPPGNQSPFPRVEPKPEKEVGDRRASHSASSLPAAGDDASAAADHEGVAGSVARPLRSTGAKTVAAILGASAIAALIGAVRAASRQPGGPQLDGREAGIRNK